MSAVFKKTRKEPERETLTEAYEVRAFRDDSEGTFAPEPPIPGIVHPEPGSLQLAKDMVKGHGEQRVVPDDCEFGDNEMCNVET